MKPAPPMRAIRLPATSTTDGHLRQDSLTASTIVLDVTFLDVRADRERDRAVLMRRRLGQEPASYP